MQVTFFSKAIEDSQHSAPTPIFMKMIYGLLWHPFCSHIVQFKLQG